jgi:hypothetical protein
MIHQLMETVPEAAACLNCGAELAGRWCSQCGQRAVALRPSLHELLHDAAHELAHFDGKIIRTAGLLLFKPGALTVEFLEGKRVRSVSPIRIYLLCSLLFFVTLSLLPTGKMNIKVSRADAQLTQAAEKVQKDPSLLTDALQAAFPKAMFVLMPLFGLIVIAFYWRAEKTYVPHFYFAVHYHAFAFVVLAVFEGLSPLRFMAMRIFRLGLLLMLFVYLGMALRRVYGGKRWLTAAKTIAILSIYACFVLVAMGIIALVTLRRL